MSQLKASPQLLEFLLWYLEDQWREHIFTKGYGEDRAEADGYAKSADNMYNLLEGMNK